ncbi:uncharacterized protein LOC127169705 isoform X2 [Labeo rohita]|uniref:uncharacterized protein LOC127169705 isoform X2 n=1 Tax=Labeo rohita TaxID=84645 RepID=UPI0021E20456|nr:uncharacterized protein LOC127169705 isoform X2 [Labeo rohita]
MSLKEEPESEAKRNQSESPEFTSTIHKHTDLSEETSVHEHKNKRANSERAHSPAPSYMSLKSDWSMDLPTNFKSGEAFPLGLSESKKGICELPTLKDDHVEITHLSKEPSDEHKNIRVKSERAASPAPSYMSLRTDWSKDLPTNFKDFRLDTRVRSERAASPTLSLLSDLSVEPPANYRAEDAFSLDSRLLTSHHFRCPVCKSMLKDPVSISCGHNYCRGCINEFWDNCAGDYVCPQCGNPSETRPVLNTNAALAEVVKSLQQAGFSPALPPQSYAGLEDVACDFCTEQRLKAVKCCSTCGVSFCETHVRPHYTIPALQKHTLSDVTGDIKTKPSQEHQNTDSSFSSTVNEQQDQTDKTQHEEIGSILNSVLNTCTSETEVSKDDTTVSGLALLCSKQQDDSGHTKGLSKLNENDKKNYDYEDHENDYEDYTENDLDAWNDEVEPEEYDHFDAEGYDDTDDYYGDNYADEREIDDYNDTVDYGDYYDDYD